MIYLTLDEHFYLTITYNNILLGSVLYNVKVPKIYCGTFTSKKTIIVISLIVSTIYYTNHHLKKLTQWVLS